MRLSACIEMLFSEHDFYARPAAAQAAGLDAFEFWSWASKDIARLSDAAQAAGLPVAACTVATRDPAREKALRAMGLLDKSNAAALCESLEETCEYVRPLSPAAVIVTVGSSLPGVPREAQAEAVVACLRAAAPIAERYGIVLLLEPLNALVDHKGYFLTSSDEAFSLLRTVNNPNVKLLFDVYHQQISEGNLIRNIEANLPLIGHFHAADNPGRGEPGTGEIDYGNVLAAIARGGYEGHIGLEYRPTGSSEASLAAVKAFAARAGGA